MLTVSVTITGSYMCSIAQLLNLDEINMRIYGAEYNNIERGEVEFNIVVLCSINLILMKFKCSNCFIV